MAETVKSNRTQVKDSSINECTNNISVERAKKLLNDQNATFFPHKDLEGALFKDFAFSYNNLVFVFDNTINKYKNFGPETMSLENALEKVNTKNAEFVKIGEDSQFIVKYQGLFFAKEEVEPPMYRFSGVAKDYGSVKANK